MLMAKPNWIPRLSDVLGHQTQEVTKVSPRTGNEYTTDIISQLSVLSTGLTEELEDGKVRYSIVDPKTNLEYAIKAPDKIAVKFGTVLSFKNVCGGSTKFGGWYSADSVAIVQRNA